MNVKLDWFVTADNQGADQTIVREQNETNVANVYREVYYAIQKNEKNDETEGEGGEGRASQLLLTSNSYRESGLLK